MSHSLKLIMAATALLWAFTGVSNADTFTSRGNAYRVVDGDTVARGKHRMRIRGMDAPEVRASACGETEHTLGRGAKNTLAALLAPPARVTVRRYKRQRDRYGREVVDLWANGRPVAGLMIKSGHAKAWDGSGPRPNWCGFAPSGNVPFSPSGNVPAGKALRVRG